MTESKSMIERAKHARELLAAEEDAWVCSASAEGDAYVVPLTYQWDGTRLLFSTPEKSRTVRDLRRARRTRVSLPSTRDVVIMDGAVDFPDRAELEPFIDAFVAHHTWDPRQETQPYAFLTFTPVSVQAWSIASELPTRVVMRDGRWLDLEPGNG